MKKIAITLARKAIKYNNIFSNGIHQNIYTLQKLLTKTGMYDIHLIYDYTVHSEPFEDGTYIYRHNSKEQLEDIALLEREKHALYELYPHINVDNIHHRTTTTREEHNVLQDFDLLIEAGCAYDSTNLEIIKKICPKIKVVLLTYGNMYFGALEKLIFPSLGATIPYCYGRDAVWLSPHFEEWMEWHKTLLQTPVASIAPYVWSPEFFEKKLNLASMSKETFLVTDKKNVAVVEPNLGFVKTCLTPIATIENLYNKNPDAFEDAYIFNADHFLKSDAAKSMFTKINIVKNGKISFEPRRGLEEIFTKYGGILLSHQHCCALNYVFLEALYLNIPLVHNSPFFKEAGYYYEGFDVNASSLQLEKALEEKGTPHPNGDRAEEYIWQYSPENPNNINGYIKLIEEVLTS